MRKQAALLPVAVLCLIPLATAASGGAAGTGPSTMPPLPAQGRNSISGVVFDPSRRPVPSLQIELLDEVEARLGITLTDNTGRYYFNSLSDGNFLIRPVTAGTNFARQTWRVHLFPAGGRGAHHEQLDLQLRILRSARDAAGPVSAGLTFAQEVPEHAQKAYERGVDLLDNKNDAEAGVASLQAALALFPDYYLALERLGLEYVRRQQYAPARELLNRALAVNAKGHGSYYVLGVVQYSMKEYGTAAESLRRMLSLAPTSPNAPYGRYYLGLALLRNGRPAEAEAELRRAYEDGSGRIPADCHMALAQVYSNSKRYREAADELELYLKEAPDAEDAERIRGLISQLRAKAK